MSKAPQTGSGDGSSEKAGSGQAEKGARRPKPGSLVFTSGQLPIDVTTGVMPVGIAAQAEESCKNVAAILHQAGTGPENTIKTACFLSDMKDFAAFNEVYAKYFTGNPARSCVAVRELPKGSLCEIEVIAEIK